MQHLKLQQNAGDSGPKTASGSGQERVGSIRVMKWLMEFLEFPGKCRASSQTPCMVLDAQRSHISSPRFTGRITNTGNITSTAFSPPSVQFFFASETLSHTDFHARLVKTCCKPKYFVSLEFHVPDASIARKPTNSNATIHKC